MVIITGHEVEGSSDWARYSSYYLGIGTVLVLNWAIMYNIIYCMRWAPNPYWAT